MRWLKTIVIDEKIPEIEKRYWVTIITCCIVGFATHMFMFTNLLPGNDETMFYFNLGGTCSFGRWGLYLLTAKIPIVDISLNTCFGMPWVKGMMSILLLACVSCCVIYILEISNSLACVLIGAVIVTYPSVTATFSYMFTSSPYFFGLLLACMSIVVLGGGTKRLLDLWLQQYW